VQFISYVNRHIRRSRSVLSIMRPQNIVHHHGTKHIQSVSQSCNFPYFTVTAVSLLPLPQPTNILSLHSLRNVVRLLLQLTALPSLTRTVRHLLPDPLPYHSPSVRPHERSSCTVNDKSYLSDKIRTLYYVSQLQNVYGILAKVYEDYCLQECEAD
jgi:hypothetical protein